MKIVQKFYRALVVIFSISCDAGSLLKTTTDSERLGGLLLCIYFTPVGSASRRTDFAHHHGRRRAATTWTMSSTFPRSAILVLTPTSIHSLVPSTIISQVSSLIDTHQLEDALALADQRKRRLEGNLIVNEDDVRSFPFPIPRGVLLLSE